jgi:small subunit ribosomal protein S20
MAHHQSAEKRIRTSWKQNRRNVSYKSVMKNSIKRVLNIKDKEAIQEELNKTYALLDKLAAKGIIHKNKAANKKSKLARYANSLP